MFGITIMAIQLRWVEDQSTAEAFFWSKFHYGKRTGWPRILNTATNLLFFPLSVAETVLLIFYSLLFAALIAVARLTRSQNKYRGQITPQFAAGLKRLQRYDPINWILTKVETFKRRFDNRPQVLYLRPFRMDNRLAVLPPQMSNSTTMTLESLIANEMRSIGQMIALGEDSEAEHALRAVRIRSSENSWKERVLQLCESAKCIILIPEDTEGTQWEMDKILARSDLRAKAIFLNIAAAGGDLPAWHRERRVYCEDDGRTFMNALLQLAAAEGESLDIMIPPPENVFCAAIIGDEIVLFCAKRVVESGLWASAAKMVVYKRSKVRPYTSDYSRSAL
jgi:hypothetical protein